MTDRPKNQSAERRLADIVREVKIAAADRDDVVVDLRDADRARLELLAEELAPVVEGIDPEDDRFDIGITTGQQPRLWIDAVAHIHMGRDRRIFRFVRDTRLGRVLISESGDIGQTADAVARYIAERVIEREKVLAGDFEALRQRFAQGAAPDGGGGAEPARTQSADAAARPAAVSAPAAPPVATEPRLSRSTGFVIGTAWFILGCVAGAAALVVAFWDRISGLLNP